MFIIKNKYAKLVITIALSIAIILIGITFVNHIVMASSQPHIESATTTYYTMGFYILSIVYGVILLVLTALFATYLVFAFKKTNTKKN